MAAAASALHITTYRLRMPSPYVVHAHHGGTNRRPVMQRSISMATFSGMRNVDSSTKCTTVLWMFVGVLGIILTIFLHPVFLALSGLACFVFCGCIVPAYVQEKDETTYRQQAIRRTRCTRSRPRTPRSQRNRQNRRTVPDLSTSTTTIATCHLHLYDDPPPPYETVAVIVHHRYESSTTHLDEAPVVSSTTPHQQSSSVILSPPTYEEALLKSVRVDESETAIRSERDGTTCNSQSTTPSVTSRQPNVVVDVECHM